ncbi:unnamed protein product [Caretta caretta]
MDSKRETEKKETRRWMMVAADVSYWGINREELLWGKKDSTERNYLAELLVLSAVNNYALAHKSGLPATEYPEDLEGPDCSPGQRESDTEGEQGWPAAEYLEEPELPTADYPEEMEDPELPAAEYPEEMEGSERPA